MRSVAVAFPHLAPPVCSRGSGAARGGRGYGPGGQAPSRRLLAPPPPRTWDSVGPPLPPPRVPLSCGPASSACVHVLSRLRLSRLCAALSARAVCRGAGQAVEGMAALPLEKGFFPIGAAHGVDLFSMSGFGVWGVLGRSGEKLFGRAVGGRGRRGVMHPARRLHPRWLWLRSKPGEESGFLSTSLS